MEKSHFSLTWDRYNSSMCAGLSLLQQKGELVDLTLAADGRLVKVHQIVLGIASTYMMDLIQSVDCKHPIIFMNNVSYKTLCSILEYVYMGEVLIEEDNLPEFLETAKTLKIKGLEEAWLKSGNGENEIKQVMESTSNSSSSIFKKFRIDILDSETTALTEEVQLPIYARNVQMKREHPPPTSDAKKKIKMSPNDTSEKCSISQSMSDDATETCTETQNDSDHDFETSQNDDQSDDEVLFNKKECKDNKQPKVPKVDLKFTVSNKGGLQLILNRYMYSLRNYRKEHGSIRRWQCVDHRHLHCPAVAVTDNNIVIKRKSLHNHTYHDKRILMKIDRKAVFSAIRTAENNMELIKESFLK